MIIYFDIFWIICGPHLARVVDRPDLEKDSPRYATGLYSQQEQD